MLPSWAFLDACLLNAIVKSGNLRYQASSCQLEPSSDLCFSRLYQIML